MSLQEYFSPFREQIIGIDKTFSTPYGDKKILYADWTASGRLYKPIEERLQKEIGPFVGNTHTETSVTGSSMTMAYHHALKSIKKHVGAYDKDVIISSNSGMTGVANKFQRILGLKIHEKYKNLVQLGEEERPIIFVTHMEHHSNQTSWIETVADIEIIQADDEGLVDLNHFAELLETYKNRKTKIAAVTSCSNVTGVFTPYHTIAEMVHKAGGLCFVDFAASAPYIEVNMRPENKLQHLDAIYFSPHKFLGGPSGTGVLIFDPVLYTNKIPDNPGGGTVSWTNPWGEHKYIEDIEAREDGGTPAFLQTMRVALSMKLKEEMGVENIRAREEELLEIIWDKLESISNLHILAENIKHRLPIISFYVDDLHYNLMVKLLNDRYGIQVRGGCSCAGTYGHYLLHVDPDRSANITKMIDQGDLSYKPGWVRLSLHPTITDEEVRFIGDAIAEVAANHTEWGKEYVYNNKMNEFFHTTFADGTEQMVKEWFEEDLIKAHLKAEIR